MKLPLGIAKKLHRLASGEVLPKSRLQHSFIERMIEEGVIYVRTIGRSKQHLFIRDRNLLCNYLKNIGINDLPEYIEKIEGNDFSRSEAIRISSNSKLKSVRTFRGFPVNCLEPVIAMLHDAPVLIQPYRGIFTFIYDYKKFIPDDDVIIIGIENSENFRFIEKQAHLFRGYKSLFVSRYPQSRDLIEWLCLIPNTYIHFGDFDFEGINIYYSEFEKRLKEKAMFFIPDNIEEMLKMYGNRELYDRQFSRVVLEITDERIQRLVSLMHKYKKCLEQEIFIKGEK